MSEASTRLLVTAAMLGTLFLQMGVRAESPTLAVRQAGSMSAQFRGCETAGWCRFWIESLDPLAQSLHRVYPDGVPETGGNDALAIAVRDRLNALLSSMVHQHKRIVLDDLRDRGDGTFAATVTVNEANVAADPIIAELGEKLTGTIR
jgi:hypothetical protein